MPDDKDKKKVKKTDDDNDTRITKEDIEYIKKNEKLIKDQMALLAEQKKKDKETKDKPDSDGQPSSDVAKLQQQVKDLVEARKSDLLKQLSKKEQEKYKDKTLSEIQLLVEYKQENPPKGIRLGDILKSDSTDPASKSVIDEAKRRGGTGSYDSKTGKWVYR